MYMWIAIIVLIVIIVAGFAFVFGTKNAVSDPIRAIFIKSEVSPTPEPTRGPIEITIPTREPLAHRGTGNDRRT